MKDWKVVNDHIDEAVFSTDPTLGGESPSDTLYPSEAAVKAYVDEIAEANFLSGSYPGLSWNAVSAAEQNYWHGIAYGNGVFVAVSADGTNRVMRSTDYGQSWNAVSAAEQNYWYSISYGNGVFVAVSSYETNRVMRSTDYGQSWNAVSAAEQNFWHDIAYGNGVFVAVSADGNNRIMVSDGTIGGLIEWLYSVYLNGATDSTAIHDNVASEISAITEKTSLADADLFLIEDSAESDSKKKVEALTLSYYAVPAGTMLMFGAAAAPTGFLLCDGAAVSRTTYATLYGIIGTTFGTGNGSTTFNVPDMRGVYPKGAGATTRAAGVDASGNAYAATLGAYAQDKMQGHYHRLTGTGSKDGLGVNGTWTDYMMRDGTNDGTYSKDTEVQIPVTDGTNGTPRTGHTTEPQSLGVTFIIKY